MAKPQIYEKVTNVIDDEYGKHTGIVEAHWQPGYVKQFPLKAALALLFVILATAASITVLCVSDRRSSSQWSQAIEPSVVLSILTAASSIALATALIEGVSVAWWRGAMNGATVAELHRSWSFTASVTDAMRGAFQFKTIALAVMATKLVVVDNILFQRATSSYVHEDQPKNISLLGAAATDFPTTGFVVSEGFAAQTSCDCFMIGDSFTPVVNMWETSNGFFQGFNKLFQSCDGICWTHIPAIGFEIDCDRQEDEMDIATAPIAAYDSRNSSQANSTQWTVPIFNSSFAMTYQDPKTNSSSIKFDLQYFQSKDPYNPSGASCAGSVFNIQCRLRPAMVNYPITITNFSNPHVTNGVNLGPRRDAKDNTTASFMSSTTGQKLYPYNYTLKQANGFQVQEYLYLDEDQTLNSTTQLGGIASALSQFLSSNAIITYTGGAAWGLRQQGALAQTMMYGPPNMGSCDCSFRHEALDTVVSQINQLTFLTATGLIDNTAITFPSTASTSLLGFTFPSPSFLNNKPMPNVNTSTQVTVQGISSNTTTNFRDLGPSIEIRDVVYYRTHYLFLGLGVGFTTICVILVLLPFWRYGEIGREVTLGPIEIASAFGAPALTSPDLRSGAQMRSTESTPHITTVNGFAGPERSGTETDLKSPAGTGIISPLSHQMSFSNVDELLAKVGHRKVIYGRVDVIEGETVTEGNNTSPPIQGNVMSPPGVTSPASPVSGASTTFSTLGMGKRRRTEVLTFDDVSGGRVKPLTK